MFEKFIFFDYNLASHTTSFVCVNLIHNWLDIQFKVDSVRQIFGKVFMAISFTPLRGSCPRNIFLDFVLLEIAELEFAP